MPRESDIADRMMADATLMAILTGGVYISATTGPLGISRDATPAAFDATGYLLPCALVRERALVPDNAVRDGMTQTVSAGQVVEVWVYEDRGYTAIDAALARLFVLLEGYQFAGCFPAEWVYSLTRQRDAGALDGASLARTDFMIRSIEGD